MKDNKITLFVSSLAGGGAEGVCVNVANGLAKNGWDVDLIVLHLKNAIQDDLTKSELNEGMNRFLSMYPKVDVLALNLLVESVVNGLNRNAHMSLLLTHFIIQLKKEIKQKALYE